MNSAEAKAVLDSLARFGMRFGLDRMHAALERLGHPERRYRILHVAGTNGKGSTCAFSASMFGQAGLRVGLYTSPHLVRVNERICVDGEPISDADLAAAVEAVLGAYPEAVGGSDPMTFFELNTVVALQHFASSGVDVAVLEAGLGGRLDATNAVVPQVTAVTRIALDHTALLGSTLAAIAGEKAGIFKPGARVVLAQQHPEALEVLLAYADRVGEVALVAGRDFELSGEGPFRLRAPGLDLAGLELGLLGPHQRENAETAIAAARALEPSLSERAIREGLKRTRWPGRLEQVSEQPRILLDGAHNPNGAEALARAMEALFPSAAVHLVFGVLKDKDVLGVAQALVPLAHRLYLASPANERALPGEELRQVCRALGRDGQTYASVRAAIAAASQACRAEGEGALVLVAGSLYVIGEARAALVG